MPLYIKEKFLEGNSWALGDLKTARDKIDIIIRDMESNGSTHIDYVLEKLSIAESILNNITTLCKEYSKENKDVKENLQ